MLVWHDKDHLEMSAGPALQVDVQVIMSDVRRRVRAQNQREASALRSARQSLPADLTARVSRLHVCMNGLRTRVAQLRDMPRVPSTLRGRLGAIAVRVMRRSLFWLIPNLTALQEQLVASMDEQAQALEDVVK